MPPAQIKTTIQKLDSYTSKQIAAGEVIERPACIARELLDNSIDAGAKSIEIVLKNGGLEGLCVSDDGSGMNKADLLLCCASHATSKIRNASELLSVTSLGFRGEALASISAISRTTITAFDPVAKTAHRIIVENNKTSPPIVVTHNKGTRVDISKLFHSIPVRKKFLSSAHAERARVKVVVLSKAAAFPHIAFIMREGSEKLLHLNTESAFERAVRVANQSTTRMFVWHEASARDVDNTSSSSQHGMTLQAAFGLPEATIKNRKHIHLYINNRPIKSFQLTQAVEYAYKNIIHSAFPQAVVFLHVNPADIDVNIHPTKQEVRVKNMPQARALIIHAVTTALQSHTAAMPAIEISAHDDKHNERMFETMSHRAPISEPAKIYRGNTAGSAAREIPPTQSHIPPRPTVYLHKADYGAVRNLFDNNTRACSALRHGKNTYTFVGCAFKTYAAFETDDTENPALLFLDFHAAHEKKLFDKLLHDPEPQPLLLPVSLALNMPANTTAALIKCCANAGVIIEIQTTQKDSVPHLTAVPRALQNSVDTLIGIVEKLDTAQSIDASMFARKACRAAARAGDHIEAGHAHDLLEYAMNLESPRCPHGRPLWITLPKTTLDTMIGRT